MLRWTGALGLSALAVLAPFLAAAVVVFALVVPARRVAAVRRARRREA